MRFGVHVSISGRIYEAADRAAACGCECFQIFIANPRSWAMPAIPAEDAALFRRKLTENSLGPVAVLVTYLPNLDSPEPALA